MHGCAFAQVGGMVAFFCNGTSIREAFDGPDPIPLPTTFVTFASSPIMRNDYAVILDGCLTRNDYSGINNKISVWSNMFHEISCVVSMNGT